MTPGSALLTHAHDVQHATAWAATENGEVFKISATGRTIDCPLPRGWRALQVRVSGDRAAWAMAQRERGRYALFRRDPCGSSWTQAAERERPYIIGAALEGVWLVEAHGLFQVCGANTIRGPALRFDALSVSQGADGSLWAIGGERRFGGAAVWRYLSEEGRWLKLPPPAAAVCIAAAHDGSAWTVNSRGDLWRLHPDGAGSFPECGMNANCRNCFYTPARSVVRDISVDQAGILWFLAGGATDQHLIGLMISFETRAARRHRMPGRIRSIAAG